MTVEPNISVLIAIIAAITAIISACLSGFFTFYQVRRGSRQKIAEFRKEWIENLRVHLSEYGSVAYRRRVLKGRYDDTDQNSLPEYKAAAEQLMAVNERFGFLRAYIRLNLNSSEPDHKALEDKMNSILDYNDEERNKKPSFVELARAVLKKEWDRLKTEM